MTNRWGSHDDILATLAPFAFRNTKYMCLGNNLLKEGVADSTYYSANVKQLLACPAYQAQAQRIVNARNLLRIVFFPANLCEILMPIGLVSMNTNYGVVAVY